MVFQTSLFYSSASIETKRTNRLVQGHLAVWKLHTDLEWDYQQSGSVADRWHFTPQRNNRTSWSLPNTSIVCSLQSYLITHLVAVGRSGRESIKLGQPPRYEYCSWSVRQSWGNECHFLNHSEPQIHQQIKKLEWNNASLRLGPNLDDESGICATFGGNPGWLLGATSPGLALHLDFPADI